MTQIDDAAIRVVRAWLRLERSFDAFNAHLRDRYRVTGLQLAILRIIAEREPTTLHALRAELAMHPATIGQLVDRVVKRGLLARKRAAADSRLRELTLTTRGSRLLTEAPVAGPVRLRSAPVDRARLRKLAAAFDEAVSLFGLEEWAQ